MSHDAFTRCCGTGDPWLVTRTDTRCSCGWTLGRTWRGGRLWCLRFSRSRWSGGARRLRESMLQFAAENIHERAARIGETGRQTLNKLIQCGGFVRTSDVVKDSMSCQMQRCRGSPGQEAADDPRNGLPP